MGTPYVQFTSVLRLVAGLNGFAALMVTAFSLGILGGDIDPPDLSAPLGYYLAGFSACGLALLLVFLAQLRRERQQRLGREPGARFMLLLAVLAFAGGVAGFGMGCQVAVDSANNAGEGDDASVTHTVTHPLSYFAKKTAFYR
jgi:hypothetical protein